MYRNTINEIKSQLDARNFYHSKIIKLNRFIRR